MIPKKQENNSEIELQSHFYTISRPKNIQERVNRGGILVNALHLGVFLEAAIQAVGRCGKSGTPVVALVWLCDPGYSFSYQSVRDYFVAFLSAGYSV